jgi:NADPH-dependent 7-cyano-7-deazaguanine reductase QueF
MTATTEAQPATVAALTRLSRGGEPQDPPKLIVFDGPPSLTSQALTVDRLAKLCPSTGRPDQLGVQVTITPVSGCCLEPDSLVQYLEAYHTVAVSAEHLADQLAAAVLNATRAARVEVSVHRTGREGAELRVTACHPNPSAGQVTNRSSRWTGCALNPAAGYAPATGQSHDEQGGAVLTDQTIELELPDGWTLLQVGYSTPALPPDGVSGAWFFATAPRVTDGSAAFHQVVETWAADPATKAEAKTAGHPFNYGDAIQRIAPETWRAAGLVLLRLVANEHLDLDHDEVLVELPTDDDH